TFSGNTAQGGDGPTSGGDGEGGAIGIGGPTPTLNLVNSTLSGNVARGGNGIAGGEGFGSPGGGFGGGIYSDFSITVANTTIAFNEADGGIVNVNAESASIQAVLNAGPGEGGGFFDNEDPATFTSTIVAKNTINDGSFSAGPDIRSFGTITSNGFNLIG